eukprot:CAMPEP_0202384824 /NCGR_PEP_ID=MMETSP1127-20130417/57346_1 /ASSEMBLY_ACC=CAM_ASM_000462 /TAXON_ID=3047 /ORGANISM="Dunaliella tertiolecta, Strain CCMP1320" /LENGTH=107 /DNA_ID=CAMNT_0048984775 /DNA_START=115 /DNA_END=438 /DNA_ORIENTATION=-
MPTSHLRLVQLAVPQGRLHLIQGVPRIRQLRFQVLHLLSRGKALLLLHTQAGHLLLQVLILLLQQGRSRMRISQGLLQAADLSSGQGLLLGCAVVGLQHALLLAPQR